MARLLLLLTVVVSMACSQPLTSVDNIPAALTTTSESVYLFRYKDDTVYSVGTEVRRWNVREQVSSPGLLSQMPNCIACLVTLEDGRHFYILADSTVWRMLERRKPSATIVSRVRTHFNRPALFFVGGQSNANGPPGLTIQQELEDSLGMRSAWPSLAVEYKRLMGRDIATAYAAVGGSSQVTGGSAQGDWGTGGALLQQAFSTWDSAAVVLGPHTLEGLLWSQGERDANRIDSGRGTAEDYTVEFDNMLSLIRDRYNTIHHIFRTGRKNSEDTPGWQAIRNAQETVADIDIVYRNTVNFPSLGWMSDQVHYNVDGMKDMGTEGARSVAHREIGGAGEASG